MKKGIIAISILTLLVILFWNFRLDLQDYFISKHVIYWSEDLNISYSDFNDTPNEKANYNMYFYHGLYLKANDIESAKVRAYFDKNKSWVKDSLDSEIELDMAYQKLRFDLYEVYARKFNQKIDDIRFDSATRYSDLEAIGSDIFIEVEQAEQDIFSFDNDLSEDELLSIWKRKIDSLLKAQY